MRESSLGVTKRQRVISAGIDPPVSILEGDSISDALARSVEREPAVEALVDRDRTVTYAELSAEVDVAATWLASRGVRAGDVVAASLPNTIEICTAFFATMRLGAVWLGVNRSLAPPEQAYQLRHSKARLLLVDQDGADRLNDDVMEGCAAAIVRTGSGQWSSTSSAGEKARARISVVDVDPLAPAALAYTSGTTGRPKGVLHGQHQLLVAAAMAAVTGGRLRTGVCLPLTIVNLMILGPLRQAISGGTLICVDRIDPVGLADWIARQRIEAMAVPPTTAHDLVTHPEVRKEQLDSMTDLGVGGAGYTEQLRDRYHDRFGRHFTGSYGLTEAPTIVTREWPDEPHVPGCSGRPTSQLRVLIMNDDRRLAAGEVGEICVAPATEGPWVGSYRPMLGYLDDPAATERALRGGVLHTGDTGWLDTEGRLFVTGRQSELILRGGANVYPAEVERVLMADPMVAEAVVVGRANERLGEEIVAVVVPTHGTDVSIDGLTERCRRELARYKRPSEIMIQGSLPKNAMGKADRAAVRRLVTAEAG
jgi:long-chain acyl-CoA synthetase